MSYLLLLSTDLFWEFLWLRRLSVCLQCGRPGLDPWVGKIPWRRKWQSTPVLLPRKSHGQRSLVGYSPWGRKELEKGSYLVHRHSYYRLKKKCLNGYKQCLNFGKIHRIILISELFIPAWAKVLRLSDILLDKDSGYEMTKTNIGVSVSLSSSALSVSVC